MSQLSTAAAGKLQYASTPHGFYRKIGGVFTANKIHWHGPVIASPEAIYLLKRVRQASGVGAGAAVGGVVGALVATAISRVMEKPDIVETCRFSQLPEAVRHHPDWPVQQKKDIGVLVLPRDAVEVIRHPRFTNLLKLKCFDMPFTIQYTLFSGRKTRKFLAAAGWSLKW